MPLVVLLLDRLLTLRGRDCLNLFMATHCERVPAAEGRSRWRIRRRGGFFPSVKFLPPIPRAFLSQTFWIKMNLRIFQIGPSSLSGPGWPAQPRMSPNPHPPVPEALSQNHSYLSDRQCFYQSLTVRIFFKRWSNDNRLHVSCPYQPPFFSQRMRLLWKRVQVGSSAVRLCVKKDVVVQSFQTRVPACFNTFYMLKGFSTLENTR